MSARDDAITALDAARAESFAEGASSRDAEVAELKAELATLEQELATTGVPDGYTEVKAADLQAALDAGTWAYVNDEHDYTTTLLIPKGGCHIWLGPKAVLWRNFDTESGSTKAGLIGNREWATGPTTGVISIRGTGKIQARPGMRGNVLCLWGDTIELLDFTTPYFTGGRWFMGGSAHAGRAGGEIARVKFAVDKDASSGTGGIRWATGGALIHDVNDCTSGDDMLQAVPAGNPGDPLFNAPDIDGLTYSNCRRNQSYDGRLCVAGLQDNLDNGTTKQGMKSSVRNVRWEHIDGYGGKSAFVHQNKSSVGVITGTTTLDVVIDQKYATAGQPAEVFINGVPTTGGVSNIDLSGVSIIPRPTNPKPPFQAKDKCTAITPPHQAA